MHNDLPAFVRSKVPDVLRAEGFQVVQRDISGRERRAALRNQLTQQMRSYLEAPQIDGLAEMVDLLEALARDTGITGEELLAKRKELRAEQGTYVSGVMIDALRPPSDG